MLDLCWKCRILHVVRQQLDKRDVKTVKCCASTQAWEIAADGHVLLLDVEFEWLAVLDSGGS